jgi:hypothetical protein
MEEYDLRLIKVTEDHYIITMHIGTVTLICHNTNIESCFTDMQLELMTYKFDFMYAELTDHLVRVGKSLK